MTTPHRTLQMALDALDAITDDVDGTGLNTMPSFDKALDAITALREALAAPEPEPVGYISPKQRGLIADPPDESGVYMPMRKTSRGLFTLALYAAPPAAPAPAAPVVPLTDKQILSMWRSSKFRGNGGQADWFCEGIRAAEAHHGITGASK